MPMILPTMGIGAGGPGIFHDNQYKCRRLHTKCIHSTATIMISTSIMYINGLRYHMFLIQFIAVSYIHEN